MLYLLVGLGGIIIGVIFHASLSSGAKKVKEVGKEVVHEVQADAKKVGL
jgi:hypothetical protein